MVKETEIKLWINPADVARLRAHPLFEARRCQEWQSRPLLNCYYDTPDFSLAKAKVALRIRRDGEQIIQTLKTKGSSVAGLSERNEWDWYLQSDALALEHLTDACWPASLSACDKHQLQGIFHTDFTRQSVELEWTHNEVLTRVEVALDQGLVRTDSAEDVLCELELELREGEPSALLQLALELADSIALMPSDISKAERGYRLLDPASYSLYDQPVSLNAEYTMDATVAALLLQSLSASQRLAEQYRHGGQWKLLQQWIKQLIAMRAILSSVGQVVPRQRSHALRLQLDALLDTWLPYTELAHANDDRQQAHRAFLDELQQPRWGVFSLQFAVWLHEQSWTHPRSERATRQANAPLSRWLKRFLQDELQVLLERFLAIPGACAEQQPRLERLIVWLEQGRHVLDVPELDALLGVLRNLQESVRAQDEGLNYQHLQAIASSKAWKSLKR